MLTSPVRCSRTLPVLLALTVSVVLISVVLIGDVCAQHQYDRWYFGFKQGLDFRTSPPTLITDGQTNTIEGSAVYCDPKTGNLLFYTDGVMVWDRMHRLMSNGKDLIADQSSTQAALIVPDPGDPKRFYVFHSDQSGYTRPTRGVYYSVVDMRLNSGYGDVSIKNQKLIHEGTEKLTAISICSGEAYWVIAHELITNNFVAFFVDLNGVSLVSVKSSIGADAGPSPVSGTGYLAASPNGQFIASVMRSPARIEIFKFDLESGKLYDRIELPAISNPYGVSFSPDSKKIYVRGDRTIAQYDASVWDSSVIAQSQFTLDHASRSEGALRLGPDKKLYIQESGALGVIEYPDQLRDACGYLPSIIPLNPSGQFGLPNNIDALGGHDCKMPLAHIAQHKTSICEGTCINFKDTSRFSPTEWLWFFEGGSPSLSRERNPANICFEKAGSHSITLIASNNSGSDTARSLVKVRSCPLPVVALRDTTVCVSSYLTFTDTSTLATSWRWTFENAQPPTYSGRTPAQVLFYRAGKQKVTLTASNQYGYAIATSFVTVKDCNLPIAKFVHDTETCAGESLMFTNITRNVVTSYEWMFAGASPSRSTLKDPKNILYPYPGDFQVVLIASNELGSDTAVSLVHVSECVLPSARLSDHTICEGDAIWLEDSSSGRPTYWKWKIDGANIPASSSRTPGLVIYKTPGTYELTLIVGNSRGADTITRHVRVTSARAAVISSLILSAPIVACTQLDTAIWIQAGCKDDVVTNIASSSPLVCESTGFQLAANSLLRVPLMISPKEPGKIETSVTISFDGCDLVVPCQFTVVNPPESFTYSFVEEPFVAGHCTPVSRVFSITNNTCTHQQISDVRVVSDGTLTPFSTDFVNGASILPNAPKEINVTYDPTLPGDTKAKLVITTPSGNETEFNLYGVRNELPQAIIGLGKPSSLSLVAGEEVSIAVTFERAIGDSAAPEIVALTLTYNTDMLSFETLHAPAGWNVVDSKEDADGLRLRLTRAVVAVNEHDTIAELVFKSFLTEEATTTVAISEVACNPETARFGTCTLETLAGDSGSVTVTGGCGTNELREVLRRTRSVSVIARPNPVLAGEEELSLHISSTANASQPLPLRVTLIDIQGKETSLLEDQSLRAEQVDLVLKTSAILTGSYTLRVHVGDEVTNLHLVVTK